MASPLTVKRNDYNKNPKRSDTETPLPLVKWLTDLVNDKYEISFVIDPSAGNGNLTKYFKERNKNIMYFEFEIDPDKSEFNDTDFLLCEKSYIDVILSDILGADMKKVLVICNPPFNGLKNKQLGSEAFLEQIFNLFGEDVPVILFTPMGFRLNQRMKSKRYKKLRDSKAKITSIISLPLDIFTNVQFHTEILCFNMDKLDAHYFIPENVIKEIENL